MEKSLKKILSCLFFKDYISKKINVKSREKAKEENLSPILCSNNKSSTLYMHHMQYDSMSLSHLHDLRHVYTNIHYM